MSKTAFGTNAVTGLNVGMAPHLIKDHELTVSLNGWTEQEGCWQTADGPDVLYTGYSAISCFASGRMDGEDHAVWMDGNTLYDNGVSAGTITAGSTMRIKAIDDAFLILGAANPYIYDGNHIRELGTLQLDIMDGTTIYAAAAASESVSDITDADPAVLTVAAPTLGAVGDYIYFTDVVGMTEVNTNSYKITAVDGAGPTTYDLELDSSDFTAYGSGGTAYGRSCAVTGEIKYYLVPTMTLSDGRVMLGRARGPQEHGALTEFSATDTWDAPSFTVAPTDTVKFFGRLRWDTGGTDEFSITGTRGTDFSPGLRLYRTKAGGTDIYLEKEWVHGDSDFTFVDGADDYYYTDSYYSSTKDFELGAVYSPDFGDHNNPPAASIAEAVGQRLYLATGDDVYWSHLDGIEFWNDLDFADFPDTITALGRIRDTLVLFSADRIWTMDMTSGLPYIREVDSPVGTTYPKAMCTVDAGLLFLRTDGLWLFDGVRVECISRRAFSSIEAPATICATADTIYLSGSSKSYIVRIRDGGWTWHEGDGTYDIADSTSGSIYAANDTTISKLFEGGEIGGTMTTKLFGSFDEGRTYRVILDVEGQSRPTVTINGVRQRDIEPHGEPFPQVHTTRRLIRMAIPRLSNPYFTMTIGTSGDLKVHGYWAEVER